MNAAFILARLDSSRLPRKALKKIGRTTLIEHCITQVLKSKYFTPVLLTSNRKIDEPLIEIANKLGIKYFRGSVDNVYDRVCKAIEFFNVDIFVRVNGDSPFIRTELYDEGFNLIENMNLDFVTNLSPRTFPYGVAIEVFKSESFLKAKEHILENKEYIEHVTSYFYRNLELYRYKNIYNQEYIRDCEQIRLTIDEEEDLNKISELLKLYPDIMNDSLSNIINKITNLKL